MNCKILVGKKWAKEKKQEKTAIRTGLPWFTRSTYSKSIPITSYCIILFFAQYVHASKCIEVIVWNIFKWLLIVKLKDY